MISGKKIVLTGANSGIGLEVMKLLVQGDNKILAVDLRTDRLSGFDPGKVIPMVCDISSKEGVDAVFEEAEKKLGGIDIFYANAGFPYYETFDYVDWDRTAHIFETNVFSPIYSYQKYSKYLGGREGQFAMTVSAIGKMGMPGYALYSSSKFAVQGFQQALRLEMPKNIKMSRRDGHQLLQGGGAGAGGQSHPSEALPRPEARARRQSYGQGAGEKEKVCQPLQTLLFCDGALCGDAFCAQHLLGARKEKAG